MRKTKLFIKIICVLILILSTALLSACSASTSDSAEKYIVLIGEDPEITEKLSDIDLLVIDAEYFSQNDIARLRENGIREIYSYINIGSIESFRSYDTDFEKYTACPVLHDLLKFVHVTKILNLHITSYFPGCLNR